MQSYSNVNETYMRRKENTCIRGEGRMQANKKSTKRDREREGDNNLIDPVNSLLKNNS